MPIPPILSINKRKRRRKETKIAGPICLLVFYLVVSFCSTRVLFVLVVCYVVCYQVAKQLAFVSVCASSSFYILLIYGHGYRRVWAPGPPPRLPPSPCPPRWLPPKDFTQRVSPKGFPQRASPTGLPPKGFSKGLPPTGFPQRASPKGLLQRASPKGLSPKGLPPKGLPPSRIYAKLRTFITRHRSRVRSSP